MGMHGGVAERYKAPPDTIEPHATTLDYLVGATAGCLTGTLSGMLGTPGTARSPGPSAAAWRSSPPLETI